VATLAKLSVSGPHFGFTVLTGPISGVSAGQYIVRVVRRRPVTYYRALLGPDKDRSTCRGRGIAVLITLLLVAEYERIHDVQRCAGRIMYSPRPWPIIMIVWSSVTNPDARENSGSHLPRPGPISPSQRCGGLDAAEIARVLSCFRRARHRRPIAPPATETQEEPKSAWTPKGGMLLGSSVFSSPSATRPGHCPVKNRLAQVNRRAGVFRNTRILMRQGW